ncbi:MAG: hypothetical protein KF716_25410 [Anaerolineae bacterium]|nr:hypothetical protein [Anaerolineae bacterium]
MTQPTSQQEPQQPARRRDPSRFIPLIIVAMALCLVTVSAVVTRRVDEENKDFELNVTKTIQAQIEIATMTAEAVGTDEAHFSFKTPTVTPTP